MEVTKILKDLLYGEEIVGQIVFTIEDVIKQTKMVHQVRNFIRDYLLVFKKPLARLGYSF